MPDLNKPEASPIKNFTRYFEFNDGTIFWICPTTDGVQKIFKYTKE